MLEQSLSLPVLHSRVRDWRPPPHDALHGLGSDQLPHCGSKNTSVVGSSVVVVVVVVVVGEDPEVRDSMRNSAEQG